MKVLVTGGAGFIGSHFVEQLIEAGYDVITLDKLTYAGSKSNLKNVLGSEKHRFVKGDICDEELVERLVSQVDSIVNFAAESHVDRSIVGSKPFVSTNIQGIQVLLDAAVNSNIERFVQISTDEVYGEVIDGEFVESDSLNPRNPYAATKASADLLVQSYYTTHDLPVLITRSSNNYGPRQHEEKLIPKFITRAVEDRSLPVYGDGNHIREWTYVTDNCRGIMTVLRQGEPGNIYNIGSGEEKSNQEVTKQILDELGKSDDLIEHVDDRPGHDRRYSLDSEKVRDLGWNPETPFSQGLKRTIDYYI